MLLAHHVFFELAFDMLGASHLRDVHVVASVLDLGAALTLAIERCGSTYASLLLAMLHLHMVLSTGDVTNGRFVVRKLSDLNHEGKF